MELASPKIHQTGPNRYEVTHGDDKSVFAEFYMRQMYQEFLSEQEGRPIYHDVAHLRIIFPADRTKVYDQAVKMKSDDRGPSDPERFPRQWLAFENQKEQIVDGTPIDQWPPITRSRAMELKGSNIFTVEQFASIPDSAHLGLGWQKERELARNWLEQAKGGAVISQLMAKLDVLEKDNEMLRTQVQSLAARFGKEDNQDEVKRRGRPPRQEQVQLSEGA